LDVPPRPPPPPGRIPRRVLALLVRLPEREVARVPLEFALLLLFGRVAPSLRVEPAGQRPVVRKGRDAEVHVPAGRVSVPALDEHLDEAHDPGDVLGRLRELVRLPEPEVAGVLQVPLRGASGELGAGAWRGVVDLVVHV